MPGNAPHPMRRTPHSPAHEIARNAQRGCDAQAIGARIDANLPRPRVQVDLRNRRELDADRRAVPAAPAVNAGEAQQQVMYPTQRPLNPPLAGTHPRAGSFRSSARRTSRLPTRPTCHSSKACTITSSRFPTGLAARSRRATSSSCSTSSPPSSTTFFCFRSVSPLSLRSRPSSRLPWHVRAAPLRPRHPTRSARAGDRRWQVWGLDHAPRVPRSAAGPRPHPGLPCRPRIIVTNLHLAEGLARKRNCCDADIALITGCLFIQLVSALTATLPQGAKLVFQLTAGAVCCDLAK